MNVAYNDINAYCCDWLRNLMGDGRILDGAVFECDLADLISGQYDLTGFDRFHWFAGLGGWDLALHLAGWPSGIRTWTASCPCQPFSLAGKKEGVKDERHLWPTLREAISIGSPPVIFGEQVASPLGREWFAKVRLDLEKLGYAVAAADLCAASIGAYHRRQRLWWFAYSLGSKESIQSRCREAGRMGRVKQPVSWDASWKSALSGFRTLDDGVSRSVGRTSAARNAIVPGLAAEFIRACMESMAQGELA